MRVLIIDDQPLIVAGLRAVIERSELRLGISCAESASAARQLLAAGTDFALVLLDLELEGCRGLALLAELHASHPTVSIVVLSGSSSNVIVSRAVFLGAMGFVLKRASNETLLGALHLVLSGVVYVPPMSVRSQQAPGELAPSRDNWGRCLDALPLASSTPPRSSACVRGLTPRQADVLALLLQGRSNKLIARALNVSVDTVKNHVTSLLRTLNVTSRTQAVVALRQRSEQETQSTPRH